MSFKIDMSGPFVDPSESSIEAQVAEDQKKRAYLPVSKRYQGYEQGLLGKIIGVSKRIFYIVKDRSVNVGLEAYDRYLRRLPKILELVNYSRKHALDFDIKMIPPLDIQNISDVGRKLHFKSRWHHNGRPCLPEESEPKCQGCNQTITSSRDFISDKIGMMRQVEIESTKSSVFYTGRCDSINKAQEQLKFIFQTEMKKPHEARKWIHCIKPNEYTLTYVVNNFMSTHGIGGMGLTVWNGFDERQSTIDEQNVLRELSKKKMNIDGKTLYLNPIYFNQTFNGFILLGKPNLQKTINDEGYKKLIELSRELACHVKKEDHDLLKTAIRYLKVADTLLPEEEFFYRDLVCKILGLSEVIHCKSSTDRTMIAGAISMATAAWRNLNLDISKKEPHTILSIDLYKEFFASSLLSGRSITRYTRSSPGLIKGVKPCSNKIGFTWELTGIENPILLRMIPKTFKINRKRSWCIKWAVVLLQSIGRFFYPKKVVEQWKNIYTEWLDLQYFRDQEKKRLL